MNELRLSPEAQADLEEIKAYIAEELENPALAGAPLSSVADVESDYRFLVSGNYMVFYRAYGNTVYVDRVLYGRRDYMRVLFGDTETTE